MGHGAEGGMKLRVRLCTGEQDSPWKAEGSLEEWNHMELSGVGDWEC
jgi:hypothetical protein